MFLHWAVLALLLLLPRAVNGEEKKDESNMKYTDHYCPKDPKELDKNGKEIVKGGKAVSTMVCLSIWMCGNETGKSWHNLDTRLVISAVSMLRVDEEGRILERYINPFTSEWGKHHQNLWGYVYLLKFDGDTKKALETLDTLTDTILYIGSDYKNSYDPIPYAYNPNFLHMKNIGEGPDNLYQNGAFAVCAVRYSTINEDSRYFKNKLTRNDPESWISAPGIYRLNKASGRLTELYYDPNLEGVNFLN